MDVEKTIAFILEQQARTEAVLARTEATLSNVAEQNQKTDALLRRAVQWGIREARNHRRQMAELKEAQRQTDASLKAFIDSMRRGGNGH